MIGVFKNSKLLSSPVIEKTILNSIYIRKDGLIAVLESDMDNVSFILENSNLYSNVRVTEGTGIYPIPDHRNDIGDLKIGTRPRFLYRDIFYNCKEAANSNLMTLISDEFAHTNDNLEINEYTLQVLWYLFAILYNNKSGFICKDALTECSRYLSSSLMFPSANLISDPECCKIGVRVCERRRNDFCSINGLFGEFDDSKKSDVSFADSSIVVNLNREKYISQCFEDWKSYKSVFKIKDTIVSAISGLVNQGENLNFNEYVL
ncbi:hypothetical protein AYI69_g1218 [Smittium culicis]|uniref:Uncharacterized protein n=1 Tax=Smittium culicis TaxID=133412 RepID=A0A1R1YR16_9FUNG|nr:hypothetical protein AYI69_g1218 [Smittium culicis]